MKKHTLTINYEKPHQIEAYAPLMNARPIVVLSTPDRKAFKVGEIGPNFQFLEKAAYLKRTEALDHFATLMVNWIES